jgi:hypothetical protein
MTFFPTSADRREAAPSNVTANGHRDDIRPPPELLLTIAGFASLIITAGLEYIKASTVRDRRSN